jgi:hypothetical protein
LNIVDILQFKKQVGIGEKIEKVLPTRPEARRPRRGGENPSNVSEEAMSEIANRPTPEQMAALFQKHGIQPIRSRYLTGSPANHPPCGCLVGAMVVEAIGSVLSARRYFQYESEGRPIQHLLNLPSGYVLGLDHGFSGGETYISEFTDPEFVAGLRDGNAVRNLVLPDAS